MGGLAVTNSGRTQSYGSIEPVSKDVDTNQDWKISLAAGVGLTALVVGLSLLPYMVSSASLHGISRGSVATCFAGIFGITLGPTIIVTYAYGLSGAYHKVKKSWKNHSLLSRIDIARNDGASH